MKVSLVLLFTIFFGIQTHAADSLRTNITKATVFLSGAQIFRESKNASIKQGVHEVIIKDVSPNLNPQKIQATAKGNFLILDVQYQTEYIQPQYNKPGIVPEKIQKEINALNDSLLFIGFERERITQKLQNLNQEKQMITQSQLIREGGISDTLPEFKEVVEFYRDKLDEINELLFHWKKTQHRVVQRETKWRNRLTELQSYTQNIGQPKQQARTRYHIVVTTYSDVATYGKIEVNYLVSNAGWIPAYDLRADNTVDPMTLTYKANVYQSTGEDWDNVKLTLSTYNHNVYAEKPTIGIWRLDYTINKPKPPVSASGAVPTDEISIQSTQNFMSNVDMAYTQAKLQEQADRSGQQIQFNPQFVEIQSMAEINQNFSNVEFDVRLPYSIKADGSHKLMVITSEKMKAKYLHYMLPRMNKSGFLLAKIGDWEELSLLPGEANIYFQQTIVGSTHINPSILTDTMEVTLGRDEGLVSTRKKIGEETKDPVFSKNIRKTYTFQIKVKNTSRASVHLSLEDQIPTTKNEDITIELVEGNGATWDKNSGQLLWNLDLKPGEDKIIEFSYSIEHERGKPVS